MFITWQKRKCTKHSPRICRQFSKKIFFTKLVQNHFPKVSCCFSNFPRIIRKIIENFPKNNQVFTYVYLFNCKPLRKNIKVMADHLQSHGTPWCHCAVHVKVDGTLSKMDVLTNPCKIMKTQLTYLMS